MGVDIPGVARPNNLHLSPELELGVVDSDLYNICGRVAEIHPSLFIIDAKGHEDCSWIIMEKCEDGIDRMVFKVKELDQRVLKRLGVLMSVPLETRIRMCEEENYRFEAQWKEDELERMYEEFGRPMWTQLEHDGFIQRGVSYPKRGVKPGAK